MPFVVLLLVASLPRVQPLNAPIRLRYFSGQAFQFREGPFQFDDEERDNTDEGQYIERKLLQHEVNKTVHSHLYARAKLEVPSNQVPFLRQKLLDAKLGVTLHELDRV